MFKPGEISVGQLVEMVRRDQPHTPPGWNDGQDTGHQGEQQMLRQQLARQPPSPAAERGSDRQLPPASQASRQQLAGDIWRTQPPTRTRPRHQQRQQQLRILHVGVLNRLQRCAHAPIVVRVSPGEIETTSVIRWRAAARLSPRCNRPMTLTLRVRDRSRAASPPAAARTDLHDRSEGTSAAARR